MAQNRGAVAAASEMSSLNSQLLFTVWSMPAEERAGREGEEEGRGVSHRAVDDGARAGDKQGGGGGAQLVACSAHR